MYPIELINVSKKFKRGEKTYTLRDSIPLLFKRVFKPISTQELKESEFWAVKDVNFKMNKGEVLGIIGPNGSGKSTILKLLSNIMRSTSGEIHIRGRLSALIEVTAGFHPDFTGRENVYFNGAVLGMTKKEIDEKFDEIIEFSGVGNFIDTPVKRYSSGMSARLGFAIAAHVNPDILLVDEVLSVGDMTFQAKCTNKMRELLAAGVTIIFISHNIPLVQNLCKRVILLDQGSVLMDGKPEDVIPYYENLMNEKREVELKSEISRTTNRFHVQDDAVVKIGGINLYNHDGKLTESFLPNQSITIQFDYISTKAIENPVFSFEIIREDGVVCCAANSKDDHLNVSQTKDKGSVSVTLKETNLTPHVYYTNVSVWDKDMVHPYAVLKRGVFKIESTISTSYTKGIFYAQSQWRHE